MRRPRKRMKRWRQRNYDEATYLGMLLGLKVAASLYNERKIKKKSTVVK